MTLQDLLNEVTLRTSPLYEELMKLPNIKDIPRDKLAQLLKYNGLNHRIVASKFVKSKGELHHFKVATANDVNDMFATYNVTLKLDVENMDIGFVMDSEPVDVFKKESEAKRAI